ncbi:MAG: hypothetical protein ACLQVW_00105 [Limisphaerales bacterium]|jgi:hypothetical protein
MAERAYTYFVIQCSKIGEAKTWGLIAMSLLAAKGAASQFIPINGFNFGSF